MTAAKKKAASPGSMLRTKSRPKAAVVSAPTPPAPVSVHPGVMITALMQVPDVDIDKLKGLFELQKQYDDEIARKAYHTAKARFASMAQSIDHDGKVDFKNTKYSFATLATTLDQIRPALEDCGLVPSWKLGERDNGDVTVTCYLTHELGYQEDTALSAPRAAGGGATGMNALQSVKSTVSYLERITLYALLGLASKGDDDDGAAGGIEAITDIKFISENDAANMRAMLTEVGGKEKAFLANFKVDDFEAIQLKDTARAWKLLNAKKAAVSK